MEIQPLNLFWGFIFSTLIGGFGFKNKNLSLGAFIIAIFAGTLLFGLGEWLCFLLETLFFLFSSILTKYGYEKKAKNGLAELRGGVRNVWQVIGQGGVGSMIAILSAISGLSSQPALTLSFISAVAEANADTWAVEIGMLSKKKPRLITHLDREIVPGTSGGVSLLGETAALLGALFIVVIAAFLGAFKENAMVSTGICITSAFLGEHIDSVLGATIQAAYFCPKCQKETERKIHRCGTRSEHRRGISVVSNEFVNFLSTSSAAIIAFILFTIIQTWRIRGGLQ